MTAWSSRKLCGTYLQISFSVLQITPLHCNLIPCDSTAFICMFSLSLSSSRAVSILLSVLPHTSPYRNWRDFPQAQPCLDLKSETASHSSICVPLSPPDGIRNESCCPKQGPRSVWPVPQALCTPLNCRFLSKPNYGCCLFLLTAGPPDLRYHLYSVMSDLVPPTTL